LERRTTCPAQFCNFIVLQKLFIIFCYITFKLFTLWVQEMHYCERFCNFFIFSSWKWNFWETIFIPIQKGGSMLELTQEYTVEICWISWKSMENCRKQV
jgi:hypothetical protein